MAQGGGFATGRARLCGNSEVGCADVLFQSWVEKEIAGRNRKKIFALGVAGIQNVVWLFLYQYRGHLQNSRSLGAEPLGASLARGSGGQRIVPSDWECRDLLYR